MKKMTKKTFEKTKIAAAALIVLFLLMGCGKKFELVNLKEYTSLDGTFSIQADEKCSVDDMEDIGLDNWLLLESSEKIEDTVAVIQLPKAGSFLGNFTSIDGVILFVEDANEITSADRKEIEKPENELLSNIQAYKYEGEEDGNKYKISVVYAETDYAYYAFMYEEAIVKRHNDDYFANVFASFKENTEVIEEKKASDADLSDTVRWFNASNAILVYANQWNYQLYGGLEANAANQEVARQLLDNSWGVTDNASADETLEWLLTEGHRMDFVYDMEVITEAGISEIAVDERENFLLENFDVTEDGAEFYADWYGRYEEDGEDAVSGWDYNRALSQLANFYLAGYYTLEEALDASLEVAQLIQSSFDSWDDYMESYFTGYEYWAEEGSEERRELYEELKDAADNPYSIDFNMKLEKSW